MGRVSQVFDHDSPSAPILANGLVFGDTGVSLPTLQVIGLLSGTSAANAAFSDTNGYGQIASYGGYIYEVLCAGKIELPKPKNSFPIP